MNYDPEVPRGFQDADFEMYELEAAAADAAALRRRGICTHSRGQDLTAASRPYWDQEVPKDAPTPSFYCFHCGAVLEPGAMSKRQYATVLVPATKAPFKRGS